MDGRPPERGAFDELRELAQRVLDSNGDLADLKQRAEPLAERYLALHDRLVPSGGGRTAIARLREGDPLPEGARFSQILGTTEEPIGTGTRTRRVYLVLVEWLSAPSSPEETRR
ncbi:MAG: hypothetical protein ICV64_01610 [Thermoleophilia bacterium]|nr:hypothetical protein [Thermoleophilia bacterium]